MSNPLLKPDEIELKIMAYLDGELGGDESIEIKKLIEKDSRYKQIYESLKRVQEATHDMKLKKLPEFYWDEYWQHVYNRIERGISWIIISIGTIVVFGFLIWNALSSLIADQTINPILKGGILLLIFGLLILLISVLREKLMIRKVDKYNEVER